MKIILFLSTIILSALSVNAQSYIHYIGKEEEALHLECITHEVQTTNTTEGAIISIKDGGRLQKKNEPDLPTMTAALIVDNNREMQVTIVRESYEEFSDIDIAPSKGNLLRTIDLNTITAVYGSSYQENQFYPGALASLGNAFIEGQFRGQTVQFYPVQYNPITRVMRVYHQIEIEVNATSAPGLNALPEAQLNSRTNALMNDVYASRFINYEEESNRYEQVAEIGDMLVIAHNQYFEELAPWIQWKRQKGIAVTLVDVASINSISAISSYIQDLYNENGLTYVVLVGDENQVPTLLVNNSGGQGFCDACYGYITGNDHYSEVFIGRLLVHTDIELAPVIDKILEYEKSPYIATDWFSTAMGLGSNEGVGIGDDGEADWQHENNIKSDLMGFTYSQVWEKYDGNHTADSPTGGITADASGSPSASSLTDVINGGCSLINYTGHGDHSLIVTGSYTNAQINALDNAHKYPYFIIVGCAAGDFDDDSGSGDTFGEAWLKTPNSSNPTGGIGGSFSSVLQSWAPPMEAQDEMNKLIANMGVYSTRHTIGSIHFHGCASMNDVYGTEGTDMTDTWIIMGDPSLQLRTAFPSQIAASHPVQVFFDATSVTVNSDSEDALVCLSKGDEIMATGLISSGQCTLNFLPVAGPGSLLVTLTNFNSIPYQSTINLVPAPGPYVIKNSIVLTDIMGNNNGQVDYSENVSMNIEVENIGIEMASNVVGILNTNDLNVTITSNSHNFGDINASEIVNALDAFSFTVANTIADQHNVLFTIDFTDVNANTWTSYVNVILNAPALTCGSEMIMNDTNGNGRLESGENADLVVTVANSGHATTLVEAQATLSSMSSYVSITSASFNAGLLDPNEFEVCTFSLSVAGDAPESALADLSFILNTDFYTSTCSFEKPVNQIMEDWETGDISQFNWQFEGNAPWFVSTVLPYEGAYCMESGNIVDGQSTTLVMVATFANNGDLAFSSKTSSENGYDFLRFRINGLTINSWSGENPWSEYTAPVLAGTQTLSWVYSKDNIVSSGSDAAWVDNIVLPSMTLVSVIEQEIDSNDLNVYPNPANDAAYLVLSGNTNSLVQIKLFDSSGRIVGQQSQMLSGQGNINVPIQLEGLASGVYMVQVISSNGIANARLVKK